MQQAGIKIVAEWDAKDVNEGIKALNDKLASLKIPKINLADGGSQAKSAADAIGNLRKEMNASLREVQNLTLAHGKNAQATLYEQTVYASLKDKYDQVVSSSKKQIDAYGRLSAVAADATRWAKNLSAEYGVNSERAQVAQKRANALNDALKKIDATVGQHGRNVGNYASGFNAISTNMARIVGEMPNFAQSMKIGFMAISNNIQPLKESIDQLIQKNRALRAEGKPTESVWKALGGALFSWNTLLLVGVTALTAYGPKLVEWIKGTNEAAEATKRAAERQKEYNQIQESSNATAAKQIATVNALLHTLQSESASIDQKKGALKKLQDIYPSYFKNLDLDDVKNGKIADTIKTQLIPAILAAAEARALSDSIAQNTLKDLKLNKEQTKATLEYSKALEAVNNQREAVRTTGDQVGGATGMATGSTRESGKLAGLVETLEKTAKAYRDVRKERMEVAADNQIFLDQLDKTSQNLGKLNEQGEDTAKFLGKTTTKLSDAQKAAKKHAEAVANLEQSLAVLDKEHSLTIGGLTDREFSEKRLNTLTEAYKNFAVTLNTPLNTAFMQKLIQDWSDAKAAVDDIKATDAANALANKQIEKSTAKFNNLKEAINNVNQELEANQRRLEIGIIAPAKAAEERVSILNRAFDTMAVRFSQPLDGRLMQDLTEQLKSASLETLRLETSGTKLQKKIEEIKTSVGSGGSTAFSGIQQAMSAYRKDIADLTTLFNTTPDIERKNVIADAIMKRGEEIKAALFGAGDGLTAGMATFTSLSKELLASFGDSVRSGIQAIVEGATKKGGGFKGALEGLLGVLADVIIRFGEQLIALGAMYYAATGLLSSNPLTAAIAPTTGSAATIDLVAGGLMVAAGAALKAVKFANGGIVYGPTNALVGEYPGASNNPEVIAPLNKLRDIIGDGGQQVVVLESRISGQDILLSQERTRRRNNR